MIKIARESEVRPAFANGLSRCPVLAGEYAQVTFERCALRAGASWSPERFALEDRQQVFLFTRGTGYITTPNRAFNITEVCVFVPKFDAEAFSIHAAADSPVGLEFLRIQARMSEYDITCMHESRMTLPRFRRLSEAWSYEEEFKTPGIRSVMLLEHRNLGRLSMGAVLGIGPACVGEHVHQELQQWYCVLPGANLTFTSGETEIHLGEGDLSYTRRGLPHGSKAAPGERFDYIWFELCENGYPGEIK